MTHDDELSNTSRMHIRREDEGVNLNSQKFGQNRNQNKYDSEDDHLAISAIKSMND